MAQSSTSERPAESIWSMPFVILTMANFFQSMAAFTVNVKLPLYLDHLGTGAGFVGVIIGSFAISALLIRPFAGPAFDSFSRKKLLMAAQAIAVLSLFLYGVVASPYAVLVVRLLHGIGIGCVGPLSLSLLSEYLPPMRMASGVSVYMLAQSVAQVIGPAFGLWMTQSVGFSPTYFIAAAFLLLSVLSIAMVREIPRDKPPYQLRLGRMFAREAIDKAIVLALFAAAFGGTTSYLVLYGTKLGIENLGIYFIVYAVCLIITRPLYGRLADTFGAQRVLVPGVLCFATAYIILAHVNTLAGFVVVAIVASCGFGACVPLVQSLAMQAVPVERRGAASNTSYTGMDVGTLIGPMLAGGAIEVLTPVFGNQLEAYAHMWYVMLIPMAIAFVVIIWWNVKQGRTIDTLNK